MNLLWVACHATVMMGIIPSEIPGETPKEDVDGSKITMQKDSEEAEVEEKMAPRKLDSELGHGRFDSNKIWRKSL